MTSMRVIGLFIFSFFISGSLFAQQPPLLVEYAKSLDLGGGFVTDSYFDEFGNYYITGRFYGSGDFDPDPVVTAGLATSDFTNGDVFVAKYDNYGNYQWAKAFTGFGIETTSKIRVDQLGNVVVGGWFEGAVRLQLNYDIFDDAFIDNEGGTDGFLVKLNTDGAFVWGKHVFGDLDGSVSGLDLDENGDVYFTGLDQGGIFVAGLSEDGNTEYFFNTLSGTGSQAGGDLYISQSALIISGSFTGSITTDPSFNVSSQMFASVGADAFFTYYVKSTGAWAGGNRQIGGSGNDYLNEMTVSDAGEVYLTGTYETQLNVESSTLNANGLSDIFIIKYNPGPNLAWAKSLGGSSFGLDSDVAYDIDVNSRGAVYVVGHVTGAVFGDVDLDPDPVGTFVMSPYDLSDAFVVKLSADGVFRTGFLLGQTGDDFGDALAIDHRDRFQLAAYFPNYPAVDAEQQTANVISPDGASAFIKFYEPPQVTDVLPGSASVGSQVSVHGFHFNGNPSANEVWFGATKGNVVGVYPGFLQVEVPPGATHEPVSVFTNGLTAQSAKRFSTRFEFFGAIGASFSSEVNFDGPGQVRHSAIADFDGDGKPDIVAASTDQNKIFFRRNISSAGSIDASSFDAFQSVDGLSAYHLAVGDLNNDGLPDVAAANFFNFDVSVYLNNSTPGTISFQNPISLGVSVGQNCVAIHDLDGDGRAELIVGRNDGYLSVFQNASTPISFSMPHWVYSSPGQAIWGLAVGDLNGDLKPEIVATGDGEFRVFRNQVAYPRGFDSFSFVTEIYEIGNGGSSVALSDLDRDGLLDIVTADFFLDVIRIRKNTSSGPLSFDVTQLPGTDVWSIALSDFNGDGKVDILGGHSYSDPNVNPGAIAFFRNQGQGGLIDANTFAPADVIFNGGKPLSLAVSDLDGDGRADLVVSDEWDNVVSVYRNLNTESEPVNQPTGFYFTEITSHSLRGTFTPAADNPEGYLVIRMPGESPSTQEPQDGVAYPVGYEFGDGSVVVYSGNQPYFNASGLFNPANNAQTFSVYAFNGAYNAVNYYTNSPLVQTAYMTSGTSQHPTYFHWAKRIGSNAGIGVGEIDVSASGSIYVTGGYNADVDFNQDGTNDLIKVGSGTDVFVAMYDQDGNHQWAVSGSSTNGAAEVGEGISVDFNGNVYIMGKFSDDISFYDVDFGGFQTLVTTGGDDLFVAKFTPSGDLEWLRSFGGTDHDSESLRNGFEVDGAGNVYITGEFRNTLNFNGSPVWDSMGLLDAFIAKLNTAGGLDWIQQVAGTGDELVRDLALDPAGNVLVMGQANSAQTFISSGSTLTSNGGRDIFIIKFASNGDFHWARNLGGAYDDNGEGIAADADGAVYITGAYAIFAEFDGTPGGINYITSFSNPSDETFLARYNSSGSLEWVKDMDSEAPSYGIRLKADGLGSVYVLGIFQSNLNADGNGGDYSLTPNGLWDNVLYKYSSDGFLRWAGKIGGGSNDFAADIDVTPEHDIVITGAFEGTMHVDPNDAGVLLANQGPSDVFFAKYGANEPSFAGLPSISGFTPENGPVGSVVTINGANFSPNPGDNLVFFGATQATVSDASDSYLTVSVPVGATYKNITVVTRGLTASSARPFNVTYQSPGNMTASSFDPEFEIVPGVGPERIALADIDGNGYADLIFTNPSFDFVTVILNQSTPGPLNAAGFQNQQNIAVGDMPRGIAIADLDGDGRLDIAVANENSGTISVIRNLGSGLFAPAVSFSAGVAPLELTIGDLDLDGKPDVVVIDPYTGTMPVLRNMSTPGSITTSSFSEVASLSASSAGGVVIADLDGDPRPDIAISGAGDNTVTVFKNNTVTGVIQAASFSASSYSTGLGPTRITAADIDQDGALDLVTTGALSSSVAVLRNMGGTFPAFVQYDLAASASAHAVDDITGDGKPDIATAYSRIFRNDAFAGTIDNSSLTRIADFNIFSSPQDVAVGDIDGDGKPDLVFVDVSENAISMLRNNMAITTPTVQASNVYIATKGFNNVQIGFTPGDGNKHMIVMKQGAAVDAAPEDGIVYQGSFSFGVGSDLGNGNFVTALNEIDWTTPGIDELSPATMYHFAVYEYNDLSGYTGQTTAQAKYLTTLSGNTGFFFTLANQPTGHPTLQATALGSSISLSFSSASGVNASGFVILRREDGTDPTIDGITDGTDGFSLPAGTTLVTTITDNTATLYVDGNLTPDVQYNYTIIPFAWADPIADTRNYKIDGTLSSANATAETFASDPANPPGNFQYTNVTSTGYTITFIPAADNPSGYIGVRKAGAGNTPDIAPTDQITYTVGQEIQGGSNQIVAFIVPSGSNPLTSEELTLDPETEYNYRIYSFNGSGSSTNYRTVDFAAGTAATLALEPTGIADNFDASSESTSGFTVSFNQAADSPTGYIVIRKEGEDPTTVPGDGAVYTLGQETEVGSNEFVAFVGPPSSDPVTFNETGLNPNTTYFYRIYSFNGSGIMTNYLTSNSRAGSATTLDDSDVIDPAVTDNTPATVAAGAGVQVTATITDNLSGIANASVRFRTISTQADHNVLLSNTTGNTYTATIPSTQVGELGIEYYFEVADGAGNVLEESEQTIKRIRVVHEGTGLVIPYNSFGDLVANYRIVAVPLVLQNNTVSAVFADNLDTYDNTKWRMYRYQNGSTNEFSSGAIEPGKGYWLIVKQNPGEAIDSGPGTTVQASTENPFTISLVAGWNQIGNPYNFNLDWDDVLDANPTITNLPGQVRVYNTGTFTNASQINKMEGAFINMPSAATIAIPVTKTLGGRTKKTQKLTNPIDDAEWEVDFIVERGELQNLISGFGMRKDAAKDYDRYDGFSMPRFAEFLDVNHTRKLNDYHYSKDIVPTAGAYVWDFEVETSESADPFITIYWDNSYFGNNEKSLILWDVNRQLAIDMRQHNQYRFDKNASGNFRVIFGDSEFLRENTRVNALLFHHINPNPVADEASFSFTLPEAGDVTIEVLDITGRKTDTVFDGALEAGYHEVVYRNSVHNNSGGVYIARIRAGAASAQQRMVIK